MTSETATSEVAAARPTNRWLSITALVFGILVPLAAVTTVLWASHTPGEGSLGVAVLGLMAIIALAVIALVAGIVALASARPKWPAVIGLVLTVLTAGAIVYAIIPKG